MAWLSGYAYRAKIPCTATSAGAQTNYTKKLTIVRGSGTNAAGTIYLNSHALNWPNDVRFTKSDGSTELDFYREESDATDGTWHVELDSIGASGDTDFYCYYGKTSDTDASNGANTFQFFDDFESGNLNLWTAGNGWTAQNTTKYEKSYAAKTTGYRNEPLYRTQDFNSVVIRFMTRCSFTDYGYYQVLAGCDLHSGSWLSSNLVMQGGHFQHNPGGTGWANLPTDTLYSVDTWYVAEVAIDFEQQKVRWLNVGGADKGSATLKTYDNVTVATNDHLTTIWNNGLYTTSHSGFVDQLWVRKYIYPEPAWAAATSEESSGNPYYAYAQQ